MSDQMVLDRGLRYVKPPASKVWHKLAWRGLVPGTACGSDRENSGIRFSLWERSFEGKGVGPKCDYCELMR